MNVSVEGYVRKEQREEKARIERRELLTSDVWFKALSQDGKNKDINRKEEKRDLGRNLNQKMW